MHVYELCSLTVAKIPGADANNQNDRRPLPQTTSHGYLQVQYIDRIHNMCCPMNKQVYNVIPREQNRNTVRVTIMRDDAAVTLNLSLSKKKRNHRQKRKIYRLL